MQIRYAIKETGKKLELRETDEKYRLSFVKKELNNGYCEFVMLNQSGSLSMGVDEDGLLKKLPLNFYFATTNPHFPIQMAVGTVVFTRVKEEYPEGEIWDYELEDLTDNDIEIIKRLLDEELQKELKSRFDISTYSFSPVFEILE